MLTEEEFSVLLPKANMNRSRMMTQNSLHVSSNERPIVKIMKKVPHVRTTIGKTFTAVIDPPTLAKN